MQKIYIFFYVFLTSSLGFAYVGRRVGTKSKQPVKSNELLSNYLYDEERLTLGELIKKVSGNCKRYNATLLIEKDRCSGTAEVNFCGGKCMPRNLFPVVLPDGTFVGKCSKCGPTLTEEISVELTCPENGTNTTVSVTKIKNCSCKEYECSIRLKN